MKHKLFLFSFFFVISSIYAQSVNVTVSDGIDNASVRSRIETTTSRMLTEINAAQAAGRNLDFKAMNVNQRVSASMAMLWENSPFVCTDEEIVEHGITTGTGYQIRNIPLLMKPSGEREFNEDEYQEAVISFDKQGNVESFYLTISMNLYMKVISDNREVTDLRRRQLILDYVEQFRTSYNQKDIHFLEQVFSDDALIITGKVIQQRHSDGMTSPKVQYNKQSKQQYLSNLRRVFHNTKYLHVNFDEIEVMRHPTNKDFYGVTLHQGWTSNTYHDEGYVFLLWDFRNENAPQIHVRTWQPDKIGDKPLPKDEVFTLDDFNIN